MLSQWSQVQWSQAWKEFLEDEEGVGVIEIILVLVVLISLVAIFKKQLTSLVKSLLSKVTSESNAI